MQEGPGRARVAKSSTEGLENRVYQQAITHFIFFRSTPVRASSEAVQRGAFSGEWQQVGSQLACSRAPSPPRPGSGEVATVDGFESCTSLNEWPSFFGRRGRGVQISPI